MLSLPAGGTGKKINPAKLFGEDKYDQYYQELLSEGRIDGDNVSPDERKEGVKAYRRKNPGSKLQTAVTEKNPTGKRAARRKSFCARSAGQMKKFPKAAKDPNSRLRQARKRWRC